MFAVPTILGSGMQCLIRLLTVVSIICRSQATARSASCLLGLKKLSPVAGSASQHGTQEHRRTGAIR